MQMMGWSWPDLVRTPVYVRRMCWDIGMIKRRVEADRTARNRGSGEQRGG